MAETVIPRIYAEVRSEVESILKDFEYVGATSDEWTSTNAKFALLSLTAKGLTEDFRQKCVTVCAKPVIGAATAANVSSTLSDILNEWQLQQKISACTTDDGSVMIAAFNDLELARIPCVIHRLQNCVNDHLPDGRNQGAQRYVSHLVTCCRKIVGHFNHSKKALDQWKSVSVLVCCILH